MVVEHALTSSETLINWIVDSGVTCHMRYEQDVFVDIAKLAEQQKITVKDEYSVEVGGKQAVELFMKVFGDEIKRC